MAAAQRLKKELQQISKDPPPGCSAGLIGDDIFKWQGMIAGPDDSPYAGGVFYLRITYPSNYPFQAPKIEFTTTIFHPNIDQNSGEIYLSIFHSDWCFAYSISTVLLSILALLTSPNPECPFDQEASILYKQDRKKYNETAAEWTRKYAM